MTDRQPDRPIDRQTDRQIDRLFKGTWKGKHKGTLEALRRLAAPVARETKIFEMQMLN